MADAKCPICNRKSSILREPLVDLSITLKELGFPKGAKLAHSSCVIRVLKQRVKEEKKYGR
jgi:hypothetical protein